MTGMSPPKVSAAGLVPTAPEQIVFASLCGHGRPPTSICYLLMSPVICYLSMSPCKVGTRPRTRFTCNHHGGSREAVHRPVYPRRWTSSDAAVISFCCWCAGAAVSGPSCRNSPRAPALENPPRARTRSAHAPADAAAAAPPAAPLPLPASRCGLRPAVASAAP